MKSARYLVGMLLVGLLSACSRTPPVVGDWEGSVNAGMASIKVVVHITQDKKGELTGSLDSPMQNASNIPIDQVSFEGGSLSFRVPVVAGNFNGKLNDAKNGIAGTWQQGSNSLPLSLTKVKRSS